MKEIYVNRLIIDQGHPIRVHYTLVDKGLINELNCKHELFGLVGIDKEHLEIAEEFGKTMRAYNSLASEADVVRLKLFILSEVKRIIEERIKKYGGDIFSSPIPFD